MAETYNGNYVDQTRTLQASATLTAAATTYTTGVPLPAIRNGVVFVLDVTAAATDVGDLFDVTVQTKIGSFWLDAAKFTQVLGNGGAKTYVAKTEAATAVAEYETGTGIGAGERDIFGDLWQIQVLPCMPKIW